jgi:hypothetical protein
VKEGGGEEGECEKENALGGNYATFLNIKVDPQRRRFGRRESDFALQALIEGRAAKPERVQVFLLRWHSSGGAKALGAAAGEDVSAYCCR